MTSDLGRSCFDGFVDITCILQAFSGLSSLPQGLFFWPKGASQDFWTCICQVLCIFIDLGVPGLPYCDFQFLILALNQIGMASNGSLFCPFGTPISL